MRTWDRRLYEGDGNTTADVRPSDLLPATHIDVQLVRSAPGLVACSIRLNGVFVVSHVSAPTVGRALMNAGALMAGIEVLPNVELRRRPWWRR